MPYATRLFTPLTIRGVTFRNRIFVSPMCEYSAVDGHPTDWHLVHLGSRAVGGAGMVMVEATAVAPEGRISPGDTGIWSDAHAESFARIASFISAHGAIPGIQLAHAGRKASTARPWEGGGPLMPAQGGWATIAPSALPFSDGHPVPAEMAAKDLDTVATQFADAARRAHHAGFRVVEVHMAHGYLLHEFLSPLSNRRTDEHGGSLENRMRYPLRVVAAVREAWPAELPLFVRISATDWVDGGWTVDDSVVFALRLKDLGVDLIDCSSGGNVPKAPIPAGPGYQTKLAAEIRTHATIATGAVGFIVEAYQAEHILATEQADVVFLAREMLRDPYWALHAAHTLGVSVPWPIQYERAKPR